MRLSWHRLEADSFALRTGRGDFGGHGTGEMFQMAAALTTPAEVACFLGLWQPRDDRAEPAVDLLKGLPDGPVRCFMILTH